MLHFLITISAFILPRLHAADLVTLSFDNYDQFVPKGKEADAYFGDYALRKDKIMLVVADPRLMIGRSGSRKYRTPVAGGIIDLALRDEPNDPEAKRRHEGMGKRGVRELFDRFAAFLFGQPAWSSLESAGREH
jgi:hypothetical protein